MPKELKFLLESDETLTALKSMLWTEEEQAEDVRNHERVLAFYHRPSYTAVSPSEEDGSDRIVLSFVGGHDYEEGSSTLWAHYLWNASIALADVLDLDPSICQGKTVVELGAGAALPSLSAIANNAAYTVITDYPDAAVLNNITRNVELNAVLTRDKQVVVKGLQWGSDVSSILQLIAPPSSSFSSSSVSSSLPPSTDGITTECEQPSMMPVPSVNGFDLVLVSDCLYLLDQHRNLLLSCHQLLSTRPDAQVLVAFGQHHPRMEDKVNAFFDIAAESPFCFHARLLAADMVVNPIIKTPGAKVKVNLYVLTRTAKTTLQTS